MPEKVSILFPIPVDQKNSKLAAMTRQGIDTQTYPTTLTEIIEIQYVSTAPGAHASALNAAKEAATGTYVVHTALGVQWDTSKLERQVRNLEENPDAISSVHHLTLQSETGQTQKNTCENLKTYGAVIGCFMDPPWSPGTVMMTRETSQMLGAHRNIDNTLWEYAIRQVDRHAIPGILEEDLAISRNENRVGKPGLLAQGPRHPFLKVYLDKKDTQSLFSEHAIVSDSHGDLIRNALYQRNDDLAIAHQICQDVGNSGAFPEASYWHGVIHRRERDFKNALNWFGKTAAFEGNDVIYRATCSHLQRAIQMPDYGDAREIALNFLRHLQTEGNWDARYFTNLCASSTQGNNPNPKRLLEDLQEIEFQALFRWTFHRAVGIA